MIYLLLSVLCSAFIFIHFKWIARLKENAFQVIVLNYFVAGIMGWSIVGSNYINHIVNTEWLIFAIPLGCTFTGMFYLMAKTTERVGAASTSVANKMSVVIPVSIAFWVYGDEITTLKIIGIALAIIGIIFATKKAGQGNINKGFWLIVLLFIGSGLIDAIINFLESFFLYDEDILPFTTTLFLSAFATGLVILLVRDRKLKSALSKQRLKLGIFLGLINFGSIYFLIMALHLSRMESSILFPLNNIGVVVMSAFLSVLIFKEKLSRINYIGIGISVLALVLLMLSN